MRVAYSTWLLAGLLVITALTAVDAAATRRRKSVNMARTNASRPLRKPDTRRYSRAQRSASVASSSLATDRLAPDTLNAAAATPSSGSFLSGTFAPTFYVPLTFGSTEQTPPQPKPETESTLSSGKPAEVSGSAMPETNTDTLPASSNSALDDTTAVEKTTSTNAAMATFQPEDQAASAGSGVSTTKPEGTWDKWSRRLSNIDWKNVVDIVGQSATLYGNYRSNQRPAIAA
ncbi:hypothetical protein H4R35_000645 [Dimargaris xerosporica]|nr:hypothetical protein H4R35_000645 [Dimargaris xerosporica]